MKSVPRVRRKPADIAETQRAYEPFGAARHLMYCKDRELMMVGPAGTGKTRAVLEKIFICAQKYPAMRALLARKTRASMSQSVLVTLEEKVLPAGYAAMRGAGRARRASYRLANRSELVIAGLDNPDRIMSTEFDLAAVFEATEIELEDWEKILSRLRNGVMPYQQAIADCNPGAPTHWLHHRLAAGSMTPLQSVHQDNPFFFDAARQCWTPAGLAYRATLGRLTGVRRKRLLEGIWAAAEGAVYPAFSDHIIPVPPDKMPPAEPVRICGGIDWGWTDSMAILVGVLAADDRLYIVDEFYQKEALIHQIYQVMRDVTDRWSVELFFCDQSRPELIKEFIRRGFTCVKRKPEGVLGGIRQVTERLVSDRLKVYDSCQKLITEAAGYHYHCAGRAEEAPVARDDHTLDALRYLITGLDEHTDRTGWHKPPPPAEVAVPTPAAPQASADRRTIVPSEVIWGE